MDASRPGYHRSMSAPRRRPTRAPAATFRAAGGGAGGQSGDGTVLVLLLIAAGLSRRPSSRQAQACTASGRRVISRRCTRCGSGRTRSSTQPTARSSERSPRSATGRSVPLDRVSPWIPKATVAIEDRRFYSHGGVDPQGIARAVVADMRARSVVQGGSTITQQLVRNLYISNERTVQRKLKEACLAIKLNDAWSKQRILAAYLNQVYYGNLAYGIEAAAQTYFSKHARDLNLREAALLAGLTQAPSAYNPFVETGKAIARRDAVLAAMREQGTITEEQYAWAIRGATCT